MKKPVKSPPSTQSTQTTQSTQSTQNVEEDGKPSHEECGQLEYDKAAIHADLKLLAHRILADQEMERSDISKWLSDDLGQMLLGIGARLAALQQEAKLAETRLNNGIGDVRQCVAQSARTALRIASLKKK